MTDQLHRIPGRTRPGHTENGGKISWDESAPLDNHPYKNTGKDSDVNFGYVLGISSQIVPPFSWKELSFMFTSDTYESMMIAL